MTHIRLTFIFAALLAVAAFGAGSQHALAQDAPDDVLQQFIDEINAGDAAGAAALVSEDLVLTEIGTSSFALYGRDAFEFGVGGEVDVNAQLELSNIQVDGNEVTADLEYTSDDTDDAGVTRALETVTATVDNGLITRLALEWDLDDSQTVDYLEYLDNLDDEEAPPGPTTEVTLAAQPGGNQPGGAFVLEFEPGVVGVAVEVTPGAAGVLQPAHFHTGTCAAPGPIVEPLASVLDGGSFTILSADYEDLTTQGLIINVHLSAAQVSQYVSCGVVGGAAVGPTPTVGPGAPPPTATRPAGVTAPDTGVGSGGDGQLTVWMVIALGAGALACLTGARALVSRR